MRRKTYVALALAAAVILTATAGFPLARAHCAEQTEAAHYAPAHYDKPFMPGGTYDPAVPRPADFLGHPLGESPVRYDEVVGYGKKLTASTPRVRMTQYGETHEGRALYYLVVTSDENMDRLDAIKDSIARLADPERIESEKDLRYIIRNNPAVAWMAYSIHGDELSSTDAAMQVAYQLAAGTDSLSEYLRRRLVTIIDPLQNPDGRERFLAMMEQTRGALPNWDTQSLQHTGFWSGGRGNHYLFDLNRDWFIQVHPETKGKVRAIVEWNPQLLVDSHEMGALDTYLFSPPREPFNPNMTRSLKKWWRVFAEDQARAFDRYGWSYYTEDWNEEWFPGYGSSWSCYLGAVGILYEQAGVEGSLIKRHDGTYLTYGEAVHHHFVSSIANLNTAARNKDELLEDFYREKLKALKASKAYVFPPGEKPCRVDMLMSSLMRQGIEVHKTTEPVKSGGLRDYWGGSFEAKSLPSGTYVVPLNQPMGMMAKTLLEFDPRMSNESLREERYEIEKNRRSRLYDVTAWSLPMMAGIEAYEAKGAVGGDPKPVETIEQKPGSLHGPDAGYGYVIAGGCDRAMPALAALLDAGYKVRHATKPFRAAGRDFGYGSLLLRAHENPEGLISFLKKLCEETGVRAYGVDGALTEKGPDLGGRQFQLLEPPRVCLLAGSPISEPSYGAVWHMLDHGLGLRSSRVEIGRLSRTDIDKYNVIVMPNTWRGGYQNAMGKSGIRKIRRWIEEGGTLIAMGSAAAAVADTSVGLSKVMLRRQALDKLDDYETAVGLEPSEPSTIDSLAVWEARGEKVKDKKPEGEDDDAEGRKKDKTRLDRLKDEDERLRLFAPSGALLKVDLDEEHWLAAGAGDRVPALIAGSYALMSKHPVETVGRLAEGAEMRLSGLLWPEARNRWAHTAYLTRERVGKGQIILFLNEPYFRAQCPGTGRLLMNAIVLGPGMGTTRPVPW
jgi:hypothetical protein